MRVSRSKRANSNSGPSAWYAAWYSGVWSHCLYKSLTLLMAVCVFLIKILTTTIRLFLTTTYDVPSLPFRRISQSGPCAYAHAL